MAMPLGAFGGQTVGAAIVEILGVNTGLTGSLAKSEAELKGFAAQGSGSLGMFSGAATRAFGIAGIAATAFAIVSIKAYEEHAAALAQLDSVIKSTPTLVAASTA